MQEDNVKVAVRRHWHFKHLQYPLWFYGHRKEREIVPAEMLFVRPLLPKEKLGGEQICVRQVPNTQQVVLGKDRAFTFDYTFSTKCTQEELYTQCVEPLVKSLFEGYNSTVFAYGQTGSGKTYTIGGGDISALTEEEYGVIPRALHQMFDTMATNTGVTYDVRVSYIEIYKEELRDLLDLEASSKDLHVREDDKGNTVIVGAREEQVESLDEVMSLLEAGSAARHTGSTQMNEHSSRSHSVFTVLIDIPHCMSGKFHFVDLAGSERAHRTGNVGDRFKESIHINSGLLSLGNVISSLGDPKKKPIHIPYRDSKITRILKDSLGGNAKTVMICCISPASCNFDETLNALKYANRARNIKNKPVINRDIQSIRFEEMQSEIMALREELARQRTCVQSAYGDRNPEQTAVHIRELEQKVMRLETECSHYRMIADEAYKQLTEIQGRDILSKSLDVRLKDWLELMEEIKNKVPATLSREDWQNQTIKDLQTQLSKCKSDLKSDEEIFADKTREVKHLTEQLYDMAANMNESSLMDSATIVSSLPASSSRRPKSVPAHLHSTADAGGGLRPPSRLIKTSPALFSLERVMQSFRARSQLLVSRLEDTDEVLHQTFSDDSGDESQEPHPPESAFQRRGTFRVKNKGKKEGKAEQRLSVDALPVNGVTDTAPRSSTRVMDVEETETGSRLINMDVASSSEVQRKKIKQAQLKILESNQKVRDLSINIRMKEQLICELVKTGKDAELMNKQYAEKIKALEKEKEQARLEVTEMQSALTELEAKEQQESAEKQKLEQDYKKKMEAAKQKVSALQKRQKETEKVAQFAHQHEKKIQDLELAVDRMKQQQETMQKKLKEEMEQKAKLEREMQRELQRVKELELRSEQQQKVLKRKTEEIAAVQRRLRSASSATLPPINGEEQDKAEDQKRQLDAEVERVLAERQKMAELQEELQKREAIVAKKEAMLAEKSELEIKKMRSSQMLSKELGVVSARLDSVEHKIEERRQELGQLPAEQWQVAKEEIQQLKHKRDKLHRERQTIDNKLHEGKILSAAEERRLIELDEAMDALDAAIQYKNDTINSRQAELRQSQILSKSEDNLLNRLNSLTISETRAMLSRYFDKVISLREAEKKIQLQCSETEVKCDEQERVIRELESALQRSALELDRRLTQQQQEYEKKIQLLMHQLMMSEGNSPIANGDAVNTIKIQQLEKELYFYKKTSRDLKKKIRQLLSNGKLPAEMAEEIGISVVSNSVQSLADGEAGTPRPNHAPAKDSALHRDGSASNRSSRSHSHSVSHSTTSHISGVPTSARASQQRTPSQDRPSWSGARDSGGVVTPVKISRKDLRVMSEEEVSLRRSNMNRSVSSPPLKAQIVETGGSWSCKAGPATTRPQDGMVLNFNSQAISTGVSIKFNIGDTHQVVIFQREIEMLWN
ncbi:hypothetical protein BaRGS_00029187 [Batillaria attramentaria]|uniref:Kinesin motor domain-containing protein n=1 Tax=Batillaria attramentaria TaxID=370345 RepID=A0ABD0JXX7_9CAEN